MIFVSQDMKWIVTTNVSSGTVSIIEETAGRPGPPPGGPPPGSGGPPPGPPPGPPGGDWNETVVPVGNGSEGFDITPDSSQIWVANAQDGTVSIIDAAKKQVIQTLDVNAKGANRLKFTLDGKMALISSLRGPDLLILDRATRTVIKRVPVGHGAAGILMEPGGARAFVACSPDNYITVIDLKSLSAAGRIDVGGNPDGLAWASRQ